MNKRLAALLAALALLPGLALAHGSSWGGHVRHYPARSSVHFGLSFGNGFYHPGYYSGYYSGIYPNYWVGPSFSYSAPIYTSPPVVIQTQPPVYIERPAATAEAPASAYWYYCASSKSYYPYVNECPEAWQRVPPVPPAAPSTQP